MDYNEYNKKLFDGFLQEKKRIILNPNRLQNRSIFGISDANDKTYQTLLSHFELIALTWSEGVAAKLCEHHSLEYVFEPHGNENHSDIIIKKNGKKYNIVFKTGAFPSSSHIHTIADTAEEPLLIVLLIDNSEPSQEIIDLWQRRISQISTKDIKVISYPDFIEFFFGIDEAKASDKNIDIIKKKAREIIGQKITEICTPEQKESFKENLRDTLINFDYESMIEECNLLVDDLYPDDLEVIKQNFVDQERYLVLLGEKEFAESFFTSEWLFQKYTEQTGLDNTYMVTSYIKSIEQLLWNVVFIIGQGRRIGRNHTTIDGDDSIRTTLEDFCYFINDNRNRNLCDSSFNTSHRLALMSTLHKQVEDYKNNCRNGYFHKDNLSSNDVAIIRKKTYLLYYLLLGILDLNDATISSLKGLESE